MPDIKNFKNKIELGEQEKRREAELPADIESGSEARERAFERESESAPAEKTQDDESAAGKEIAATGAPLAAARKRKEREKKIENILAKNMEEIYLNMPPDKQKEFKTAGEEAAREINGLLDKTKLKVKKIIGIIRKWLSIIPGVNKFFLEQESKIKADEIMKIKK